MRMGQWICSKVSHLTMYWRLFVILFGYLARPSLLITALVFSNVSYSGYRKTIHRPQNNIIDVKPKCQSACIAVWQIELCHLMLISIISLYGISWMSVFKLVEETELPREHYSPPLNYWRTLSSTCRHLPESNSLIKWL